MFGKILSITEDKIKIQNTSAKVEASLLGVHLIFEEKYKIVGEISGITSEDITCTLIGEMDAKGYHAGIDHRPTSASIVRPVNREEVIALLGNQEIDSQDSIYIGKNLTYEGFNVSADINSFFSNHFAIIGNSGSGKSCTVARLLQNLFYRQNHVPYNSHFVLFDLFGEYHAALDTINKTQYCRCKYLTTNVYSSNSEIVKIPPYLLEVDDLALLLGASSPLQLPLIEKALKLVYLFTEDEEKVIKTKNSIIAKALLDILTSGRNSTQIRDQIVAVLTTYNTRELNLNSEIVQPGYIRTIMQCLNIDASGKINTIQLVTDFVSSYVNEDLNIDSIYQKKEYTLKDLYKALEFALISEGVLKSDKAFELNNSIKIRLEAIINSENRRFFEVNEHVTREEYIKRLFTNKNGEAVQIINFNLNYIDERFAKVLTKIYSKMFLDYAISLDNHEEFSVEIMLEEAHRYVVKDSDTDIIGYNIFDRITKEGRKYGVILGLITQRPSELSTTALSQCSNYLVLRMYHPDDISIIKGITHSLSDNDVDKLKTLTSGTALCFGSSFHLPVYAKIDLPVPTPTSNNVNVATTWFHKPEANTSQTPVLQNPTMEMNQINQQEQKNTIEMFQ